MAMRQQLAWGTRDKATEQDGSKQPHSALIFEPPDMRGDLSDEGERACSLAREHLLRARSRALFELLSRLSDAASPSDVRVGLRAAALVREGVRLPRQSISLTEPFDIFREDGWREPA
jgi:hypothetical protein